MTERGVARRLAKVIDHDKKDTRERIHVLRLQAMAWRHLALIGLVDPEWGRFNAQWMFFNTVPFTNGPAIEKFIAETEDRARECGIKAGVFTRTGGEQSRPAKEQSDG